MLNPLASRLLIFGLVAAGMTGCSNARTDSAPTSGAEDAEPLRRIAFGSCASEDQPQPFWDALLAHDPDLFLFIGDNVYGDTEDMDTLRAKYAELGAQPGFQQARATMPVLATWDDHDYGVNDGGVGYPMKEGSKEVFMDFFDVPEGAPMRNREGIYHARTFGPERRRVQVILLDTRFFRDPLQERPAGAARDTLGPYLPADDTTRTMLGEAQWARLEEKLQEPADVRLLVSSIQAIPEEHGWE
ncbi:MAG: alkaline phosphatase D family protein, partial [Rhodothermales bacterium]